VRLYQVKPLVVASEVIERDTLLQMMYTRPHFS